MSTNRDTVDQADLNSLLDGGWDLHCWPGWVMAKRPGVTVRLGAAKSLPHCLRDVIPQERQACAHRPLGLIGAIPRARLLEWAEVQSDYPAQFEICGLYWDARRAADGMRAVRDALGSLPMDPLGVRVGMVHMKDLCPELGALARVMVLEAGIWRVAFAPLGERPELARLHRAPFVGANDVSKSKSNKRTRRPVSATGRAVSGVETERPV